MESVNPISHECRSCGGTFFGTFCNQCGEKIPEPGEKSIRSFLAGLMNAITSLDGKFLRTLKIMLKKPGEVSYHYMNGKRVPFYKPMSMFFIANLIYFLFPLYNSLNSSLYVQMNMLPHSKFATELVQQRIAVDKIDFDTFQIQYNQQSTSMAKMVLVFLVIYFSIPLTLVNYTRRMFYSDHLLVSLEACSIIILVNFVVLMWVFQFVIYLFGLWGNNIQHLLNDKYTMWISMSVLFYLFFQLERRAYAQPIGRALAKAGLLIFGFFAVLQMYRASLFFVTLWTV